MAKTPLTAAEAHKLLDYNPITGAFRRHDKPPIMSKGRPSKPWRNGGLVGSSHSEGYLTVNLGNGNLLLHRVAWLMTFGEWPELHIDHINQNREDNRISNLREATKAQNATNSGARKNSKSGHKCIWKSSQNGKWIVQVKSGDLRVNVGSFADLNYAIVARDKAIKQLHGEFSCVG